MTAPRQAIMTAPRQAIMTAPRQAIMTAILVTMTLRVIGWGLDPPGVK
jgi:hypothetical protein